MNQAPGTAPLLEETYPVRQPGRRPVILLSIPVLAFILLPVMALFLRVPPARLIEHISQPQVLQAISLSLLTSLSATLLTLLLGTPLAYGLARQAFSHPRLIETLIELPIVLPPSVAGIALLITFGRRGLLGGALDAAGIQIAFTPVAVILAQVFVSAPFYIKSAIVGFRSVDRELEQSAGLDGANEWQVFRLVFLPLSWTALLSGAVLAWARALGEFGATIIFAGNLPGRTQTMPLAIYIGFELDLTTALTLSVILVGLSFLALLMARGVLDR